MSLRFLHEFEVSPTGVKHDKGCWKIGDDGYVYNSVGERHSYEPSDDDEIIEADGWPEIFKMTVRNNSEETGFISPDGEFFGCKFEHHYLMAEYFFGMSEREMESKGFIRIFKAPQFFKDTYYTYIARGERDLITANQKITLKQRGFVPLTSARPMWGKEKDC